MPRRTLSVSEARSVVHDGKSYEFRSKSITVGEMDEWLRQVDERDPRCRSVVVEIDGSPPGQYSDEVVDACVGELKGHYEEMFLGLNLGLKDLAERMNKSVAGLVQAYKPLGVGVGSKPLAGLGLDSKSVAGLGQELRPQAYEPGPVVALPAPEDRIVDAIYDLPDRLREEREPKAHASLRWIRDNIVAAAIGGVIAGVSVTLILWAANWPAR